MVSGCGREYQLQAAAEERLFGVREGCPYEEAAVQARSEPHSLRPAAPDTQKLVNYLCNSEGFI